MNTPAIKTTRQTSVYRRADDLYGFMLEAIDGEVGKVKDLYFDDQDWTIRYLVVDTGPWILGRKILFAPDGLATPKWDKKIFSADLTKDEVEKSPDIDLEKPVSQQNLYDLHAYFQWPLWTYIPMPAGMYPVLSPQPVGSIKDKKGEFNTPQHPEAPHPNLRSTKEVVGYSIHAKDGHIGHVEDFLISDKDWMIHYMLVDTKDWLHDREVFVAPAQILHVEWATSEVYVDLTRKQIEERPEYVPEISIP